jgi:hypothetical protein
VRAPFLGELEGNQAGAVAVQASAHTDKIRRDDDEVEGPFEHCIQQPSGSNKRTSQSLRLTHSFHCGTFVFLDVETFVCTFLHRLAGT